MTRDENQSFITNVKFLIEERDKGAVVWGVSWPQCWEVVTCVSWNGLWALSFYGMFQGNLLGACVN